MIHVDWTWTAELGRIPSGCGIRIMKEINLGNPVNYSNLSKSLSKFGCLLKEPP